MAQITLNSSGVASSGSLVLQSNGTTTAVTIDSSQCAAFVAGTAAAPAITTSGDTNTGLFFPAADTVGITTGGTERARVDSSGNIGLGVTPSAWVSTFKSIDVSTYASFYGRTSAVTAGIASNAYQNSGGTWTYKANNYAAKYDVDTGQHVWWNAASGTAGNAITFTQAMTLDASGNLGIGTTSPATKVHINGSGGQYFRSFSTTNSVDLYVGAQSNDATIYVNSNHPLTFSTNATERARIDSSGNLLVGTTTSFSGGKLGIVFDGSVASAIAIQNSSTTANTVVFRNSSGTTIGTITNTNTATAYNTSSDYRLKENVQPMTGALAKVAQLKPCTYKWKADGSDGEGFIAHELQAVVPDAVTGEKDAVDAEGNPVYQGIDTSFLVATLTAALQEAHGLIKDLQTRVAALES